MYKYEYNYADYYYEWQSVRSPLSLSAFVSSSSSSFAKQN